jgi:hypothetical protein
VREVVAEAALAHAVEDKTEAAYRRATYLDEHRPDEALDELLLHVKHCFM